MTHGHACWWLLTAACLVWYSVITLYVAVLGTKDVRRMLRALKEQSERPPGDLPVDGRRE